MTRRLHLVKGLERISLYPHKDGVDLMLGCMVGEYPEILRGDRKGLYHHVSLNRPAVGYLTGWCEAWLRETES